MALLDDEPRRTLMGKLARERVEQELAWSHQESAYLGVYKRVLGEGQGPQADEGLTCAGSQGATSRPTGRSSPTS